MAVTQVAGRQRRAHLQAQFASASVLMFLLSGCTSSPEVDVPPDLEAAVASLSSLPPDLAIAHSIATRDCLIGAGYNIPFDATALSNDGSGSAVVGIAGVFASQEAARDYGYNSTFVESGSDPISDFEATLGDTDAAQFERALFGDSSDMEELTLPGGMVASRSRTGCYAEADIAVYGSVLGALQVTQFVNEVTLLASDYSSDLESTLRDLLPDYERCMADAGYEVQGLKAEAKAQELFGQYRQHGSPPSAEEQQLAVTDYGCQSQVGLATQLKSIFTVKASVWLVEDEQRILALQESLNAALKRSQAIVNG